MISAEIAQIPEPSVTYMSGPQIAILALVHANSRANVRFELAREGPTTMTKIIIERIKQGRMGWLPVGVLALSLALISSSAFALDIEQEIARQNADSAQLVNTLGRHKGANAATSESTDKAVKVEMWPASSGAGSTGSGREGPAGSGRLHRQG